MKRLLLALLALLVVFAFASCGDTAKDPVETGDETSGGAVEETAAETTSNERKRLTDEEQAKFLKVVEIDLPEGNFRDVIVDYMRYQSSIEWVCSADFGVTETFKYYVHTYN